MLKRKFLLIVLILFLVIIGVGCNQSPQEEVRDNLVWETYSNDYYTIKYPPEWNKIASGLEVGFAPPGSKGKVGFDIIVNKEGISKNKFYKKMKQETKNIEPASAVVKQKKKFKLDGQPAYKVVVADKKQGVKATIIAVYKWGVVFRFQFTGQTKQYNQQLPIAKKIIASFKFSEFPSSGLATGEDKKETDKIIGSELTTQQAIEDAEYMWEKLEKLHPNLYHSRSKGKTRQEFNQLLEELETKASWNEKELYKKFTTFVAGFKDGHTRLGITHLWSEYKSHLSGDNLVPPFLVGFIDNKLIITANFTDSPLPTGAVIKSINGIRTSQMVAKMKEMISCELEIYAHYRIKEDFPLYYWANFGGSDVYQVEYKTQSGEEKQVKLNGISWGEYSEKVDKLNLDPTQKWKLTYPKQKIALLEINTFSHDNIQEFKFFIDKTFKEINQKECKALVIDIRNNGGGSTRLGNYLYEYLTDKPYRGVTKMKVKLSDQAIKERGQRLSQAAGCINNNRIITYRPKLKQPTDKKYKFKGSVYVLVDRGTFSAAVDFATLCKDFSTATIVGRETGGIVSGYGGVLNFSLPNSGFNVDVSHKYFLRPAGFDKAQGLIPDVKVNVNPVKKVKGEDQVLKKVLQLIETR